MSRNTKDDFLAQLIGSPARAQLLRVFMFNQNDSFTLAMLAKRSALSSIAIAREIKVLEKLGVVKKGRLMHIELNNGSRRTVKAHQRMETWVVNTEFKHIRAVSNLVHEVSPVKYDSIVGALKKSGKVATVILSGTFMGDATRPADLIVALDTLNERRLEAAVRGLEPIFGREIRYAAFSTPEFRYRLTVQDRLIRDTLDFPHLVLLDRTRLL